MDAEPDDFFARLSAARSRLSPQLLRVAEYFEQNHLHAAFLSTRDIAAAAGVSLASVVRFPRAIGYADIGAVRDAIRDRVRVDLDAVAHLRSLTDDGGSIAAIVKRVVETDVESLTALTRDLSEALVDEAVASIVTARGVRILGFRQSRPLAEYLGYSLAKVIDDVQIDVVGDSAVYDRIALDPPGRLVVVIAMARYPADLHRVTAFARSRGHRILLVTDSALSPFAPLADLSIVARQARLDFVGSIAASAAVLNVLLSAVAVRLGDDAVARLAELDIVARDNDTYLRSDPA
jgi:DNA-binding MurR/RpiR family transcriptional regulator